MKEVLLVAFVSIVALSSCQRLPESTSSASANQSAQVAEDTQLHENLDVHAITLAHANPEFPPGKGRELFISRCTVCHSLRYVSMQPDFPEKTWTKEVDKMRQVWGAHITEDEAKEIIAYLVLVKGKKP